MNETIDNSASGFNNFVELGGEVNLVILAIGLYVLGIAVYKLIKMSHENDGKSSEPLQRQKRSRLAKHNNPQSHHKGPAAGPEQPVDTARSLNATNRPALRDRQPDPEPTNLPMPPKIISDEPKVEVSSGQRETEREAHELEMEIETANKPPDSDIPISVFEQCQSVTRGVASQTNNDRPAPVADEEVSALAEEDASELDVSLGEEQISQNAAVEESEAGPGPGRFEEALQLVQDIPGASWIDDIDAISQNSESETELLLNIAKEFVDIEHFDGASSILRELEEKGTLSGVEKKQADDIRRQIM